MKAYQNMLLILVCVTGCASPAYRQVLREEPRYNVRDFFAPKGLVHQAVSRAILSKNFLIETDEVDKGFILGRRSFQRGRRTDVVLVQAKIMPVNAEKCTVYLNGVETREIFYVTDRTRFFLFLIPLPGGGGKQGAQVKQGEKIISDRKFYDAFFSCVDEELNYMLSARPPSDVTVAFEKLAQDVQIPAEQAP